MKKIVNTRRRERISKKGVPPGSTIYLGDQRTHNVTIDHYCYSPSENRVQKNIAVDKLPKAPMSVNHWIDVNGIHDTDLINGVCKHYGVHALTVEDLVNTFQRPKCEEIDDYIFVTVKMIHLNNETEDELDLKEEQVSFILKDHLLVSFQERPGDVFETIRNRIKIDDSQLRRKRTDYLLFLLLDIIIDHYLEIIDRYDSITRELEEELMTHKDSSSAIDTIQMIKGHLGTLRKYILPIREVISKLSRIENTLIHSESKKYFNDVLDHVQQVNEQIEFLKDQNSTQREMHFTNMNLRMNRVMEALTIVTAIFIPLSFIASVYGMNFDNMPELHTKYGYFFVLAFMAIVATLMILYFKRKKWM
jgi:magnesium transporter